MGKINTVEFNDDASVVASGSYDATVRLWDLRYAYLLLATRYPLNTFSAQNRQPIQVLEDAGDAVQTLHVGNGTIMSGSVDGHVRIYDLRMGQLRTDFIGREYAFVPSHALLNVHVRPRDCRGAHKGQPNLSGHHAGFSRPPDGRDLREALERLHRSRRAELPMSCVLWAQRS